MKFLSEILSRKAVEVEALKSRETKDSLRARGKDAPRAVRTLSQALSRAGQPLGVIAEVKRSSPSLGTINANVDAPALAAKYVEAGAAAISVLTDGPGFGGSLADLLAVRARVSAPLLRKDFVVDPLQIYEARAHGADAVLLIVAALGEDGVRRHLDVAADAGVDALVEVHDDDELDAALKAGATLVGINNRNLKTFVVDLAVSEHLLPRIPKGLVSIAESGVRTEADARRLKLAGAGNLLVGEALVRAEDPGVLLRALRSV